MGRKQIYERGWCRGARDQINAMEEQEERMCNEKQKRMRREMERKSEDLFDRNLKERRIMEKERKHG